MDLLNKVFIAVNKEIKSLDELVVIYLYEYSDQDKEYKANYYIGEESALSEWISEKEIQEHFIPLESIWSDFNMKYFKGDLSKRQIKFIYYRLKEYLKASNVN